MKDKLIDAAKLYEIVSILMTDTVKQDPIARGALELVLIEIQDMPDARNEVPYD